VGGRCDPRLSTFFKKIVDDPGAGNADWWGAMPYLKMLVGTALHEDFVKNVGLSPSSC